jgi:hypothetical protein
MRNAYSIWVGKSEGKRLLGRTRRRREDNIKMDLKEVVWECVDWMHLANTKEKWRSFVNTVMNPQVP